VFVWSSTDLKPRYFCGVDVSGAKIEDTARIATFLFKCPYTGYRVQGHVAAEDEAADEGTFVPVNCPVCRASASGRSENHQSRRR
jgi:hypothetical protein